MQLPAAPLIGLLLLVAALLKVWNIGTGSTGDDGSESIWRTLGWYVLIAVELAIAVACFLRFRPRATRLLLLVLFACFAGFAGHQLVIGVKTCGCFGPLRMHPGWTLAIDLVLLGLIWIWHPQNEVPDMALNPSCGWLNWSSTYVLLMISAGALLTIRSHMVAPTENSLSENDDIVILDPETWIGQTLPIVNELIADESLTTGEWQLLLYHTGCPKCETTLPVYRQRASQLATDGSSIRVAFIETPPYSPHVFNGDGHSAWVDGRLSDKRQWFVQTPVEIRLRNGLVISVNSNF